MKKTSLKAKILVLTILPLIVFACISLYLAYSQFSFTMFNEIEVELKNNAKNLKTLYDVAYPGDYNLASSDPYRLLKGKYDITTTYSLLDKFGANTECEITLFYGDERILTTITGDDGSRIIGTRVQQRVADDVLKTGEAHFYYQAIVENKEYFSYYLPLKNSNGTVVGMIFVGRPTTSVKNAVFMAVVPLMVAAFILIIILLMIIVPFGSGFTAALMSIHDFLQDVSKGDLDAKLNASVANRDDELGEIGTSAISMQNALRSLIEQDTLTEIYNRRCANRKLSNLLDDAKKDGRSVCVAIADIDHFKDVNDTYGHDCGDVVLRKLARMMDEHMKSLGFAARWGGEEFLLVFENSELEGAVASLETLLDKIRATVIPYEFKKIRITVTFGVADNHENNINRIVKNADKNLYVGKESGRNQVVSGADLNA